MPTISEHFYASLRYCIPYGVMLGLFLLNVSFLSLSVMPDVEPPLILMMIYYWSVFRPTLVPAWFAFFVGIAFDFISGLPVGLHAFVYVAVRWLVTDQRLLLASQSFLTVWIGYIAVSLIAVILEWGLFGLIALQWPPISDALMMFASGVFIFPLISIILHLTHKMLPEFSEQYSVIKK